MRRTVLILLLVVATAGAGWWGYGQLRGVSTAPVVASGEDDFAAEMENVVWASGRLEPVIWAGLSPASSGLVRTIHVTEGQWVEKGTLLLELENEVAGCQAAVAAAALAESEAAYAKLAAGATAAEVTYAEAAVVSAAAQVGLAAGRLQEIQAMINSAEARVAIAQRTYEEVASHPTAAELAVTLAEIAIAQAAVDHAQAAYNIVRGDPQIGARPESQALYQATAALEAAQARAALIQQGATPQQLAVAQSQVSAAQAEVAAARSQLAGAEAAVQAAMAGQASAQATLDQVLAGATLEDLAIAEARVLAAQAGVTSAQAHLRQSQLYAPFAGQVGAVLARAGEVAAPGQFLLLLGNTQQMHVETTDLRETDVVRLRPEMAVEVTFDALPDRIFYGTITQIAPVSSSDRGSTNYTLHIAVPDLEENLRWGMTAFVNIQAPH
jgi:multidrug efflux pump subunit AcrA (membrane-fusion protein)